MTSPAALKSSPLFSASRKIVPSPSTHVRDRVAVDGEKSIEDVAREFESIFLGIVIESMRQSVPTEGLVPKGNAEKIYEQMLDQEYAKSMSETGQAGLAQMIAKQLHQIQDGKLEAAETRVQKRQAIHGYQQAQHLKHRSSL
ncbi:MAG: rod-binding protein [Zetaproteobacteria bacterium]|nr:rod-binding protein [Zetaproteobacteria bacterium]